MKSIFEQEVLKLNNSPYVDQKTIDEFLSFIRSENSLVRDTNPAHHLCCFFLPVHRESKSVYLGHHKKANSWIPPGGHIDPSESPVEAAKREFTEELGVPLTNETFKLFHLSVIHIDDPPRLCKTHYDFWYSAFTDKKSFQFDKTEFYDAGWFSVEEAFQKVINSVYKPVFKKILDSWEMLKQ